MTFDDDYMQLVFDGGVKRMSCKAAGIDWPPPDRIEIEGFAMVLRRRSQITDEQRSELTHVCRGAEYVAEGPKP